MPAHIGRYDRRTKRLQRAVSRKRKGSGNRGKAVARLPQCHRRIGAMRRDFLHQATTQLVQTNALIAIEDLQVINMTASAAGTIQAPGKNVRQKAGLNRRILRNGWGLARSMLEYKCAWHGVTLVAVPPAYSSQQCSRCRHIAADNRKTQAPFACVECGHTENADKNAAHNILLRAKQMLAGGGPSCTAGYPGTHACEGAVARVKQSPAAAPETARSGSRKRDRASVGRNRSGAEPIRESPCIARVASLRSEDVKHVSRHPPPPAADQAQKTRRTTLR
jgi:putative transposase